MKKNVKICAKEIGEDEIIEAWWGKKVQALKMVRNSGPKSNKNHRCKCKSHK